ELLCTVNDNTKNAVETRLTQYGVEPVCLGQITANNGESQLLKKGQPYPLAGLGFEHFS
ncbi:thiamine-phosphate kinase, partial [Pseudoalteromonas piscicida]